MNIKMKRIVYLLIVLMVTLSFSNFKVVEAATVELNVPSSVTEGDTITASISGKAEQWNLTLKANGTTIASTNNLTNEGSEISISKSGTYKTTEAGNVTFTLTGDYSYTSNGEVVVVDVNTSRTVTVNKITPPPSEEPEEPDTPSEPETPTTPEEPTTPSEPEKPTTPEEPEKPSEPEKPVEEPNFTASNRVMYATGDINLRASWSTASEATRIEKDTELTVTATSTNTVNGYVWYRVSYNGQTKYVAAYLLTDVKPEEEEKKSDNAFLKSLTVEGQEILPTFDKEVTSYSVQVKNDVTELDIKAVAEDEKATVDVKGNKDLKEGENTLTVSVSAEDGTIKIYEIKVTRLKAEPLGLTSLKIKDTNIENKFKTDVYEYSIDIEDVSKLEIEAIANDEKATVEILGNEDLQDGENIITIIVSSEDGEEKVTYQIKANKEVKKVEPIVEDKKEPNNKIYFYIAIVAILVIALIIVVVYVIKNRNNESKYVFSGDYDDEPEDLQEDFPEELPERKESRKEKYFFDNDDDFRDRRGKHF